MKKHMTERRFQCPDCGTISIAYKKTNKMTSTGHVKDMYCYKCKAMKKFVQIGECNNEID